jgi:hypothetical protein
LITTLKEAIKQKIEQVVMHHDFEAALDPKSVSQWKSMVEDWEADRMKPNPYERIGDGKHLFLSSSRYIQLIVLQHLLRPKYYSN